MEIVGVIESASGVPSIDQEAWIALIATRPDLVPPKARVVRNPFTGQEMLAKPSISAAHLVIQGKHVGTILMPPEEAYLVVCGNLDDVQHVADEIAQKLGGTFLAGDQLKQWDRQRRIAR